MVSVNRPLHRLSKKMALTATAEFWHGPLPQELPSSDCTTSAAATTSDSISSDSGSSSMEMSLPQAHHQLLANDQPSFENLKGYDHTQGAVSYDNLDGYDTTDSESDSSFFCRQKVSSVKQQGGGSWLLGFARSQAVSPEQPEDQDMNLPSLRRVSSNGSLESDEFSSDESSDDDDSAAEASPTKPARRARGVCFAGSVKVQAIPHSSTLSPLQRRKMFSSSWEVRQNKIRNKREYRYDGCDWRNITEEWEMGVDMVTGELIHPAHDSA